MCGIFGVWEYGGRQPVRQETIQRATDTISHRGPDDSGVYVSPSSQVGLGFRRLAIIDLSPAGHQPMSNEDASVWLVFNGEIYNYADLRPTLLAKGHRFASHSDSEVIIHHYEERGTDFVYDLNGMFDLAIWDERAQQLVLARDRVGKKPLYYYDDGQRLIFASELKAILADPTVPRQIDDNALNAYLRLGYVPPPQTILRDIRKLPPGHRLIFAQGKATVERYWDWLPAFQPNYQRTEAEWGELLRVQLTVAVRDRLMSDVPLGAFLSGGVDSSAVVAAMARSSDKPVKTFSIGFQNEKYNELPYARQVAQQYATDHHELMVEPENLRDVLPLLVWQLDEPFADSSAVPTYYVSKLARSQITVVLSGDGGDEAFAGYDRYARAMQEQWMDRLPLPIRRPLGRVAVALLRPGQKGANLVQRLLLSPDERYLTAMQRLSPEQMATLLQPTAQQRMASDGLAFLTEPMQRAAQLDYLSRMQYLDGVSYLPEDILVKVDRMSMLNSLEARCPLLDYRLLELAATIPADLRLRNGEGKFIFKQALRDWLPPTILTRAKMGFGIPLREWFRDDLFGFAGEILLEQRTIQRGYLERSAVQQLLQRHQAVAHTLEVPIWSLLVFELWCRAYLDR
ncbi:MAG: asparagine synthase (glutamine-hydrolyzing) [Caldilineaceae bacterium]